MGGIFGAIVYIISFNLFPIFDVTKSSSLAIGSSASVLAILLASATHVPNLPLKLGAFKLKHIAFLAIIIDILSITKGNAGSHIAHISGGLYGFTYIYFKKFNINTNYFIDSIIRRLKTNNEKFTYSKRENDYEYNARKNNEEKKLNSILEKISSSGYESLSEEEKDTLFNQK